MARQKNSRHHRDVCPFSREPIISFFKNQFFFKDEEERKKKNDEDKNHFKQQMFVYSKIQSKKQKTQKTLYGNQSLKWKTRMTRQQSLHTSKPA